MPPRKRKPVRPGEPVQLSIMLDPEIIQAADVEAERLTEELRIKVTRTDVVRRWLADAASGGKPPKGR